MYPSRENCAPTPRDTFSAPNCHRQQFMILFPAFTTSFSPKGKTNTVKLPYFRLVSVRNEDASVKTYFSVRRRSRRGSKPKIGKIRKLYHRGEVAEWSNAHDSKSCVPVRVPGVRIPPSPPERNFSIAEVLFFFCPLQHRVL